MTGEPLVSQFSTTDETVRDGLSGLEWLRQPHDSTLPWTEALGHCEGLDAAGHSDWRLPSAKELISLTRDDRQPVAGIADDEGDVFWTSSPDWPPERAVTLRLPDANTGADVTSTPNHVRCVRGPG